MKTRAALCHRQPLVIETVDLDGPRAGTLDRINDAFHLMHAGESIRCVVTF
jgi:Zn-dependent alcohol dehydrogenase